MNNLKNAIFLMIGCLLGSSIDSYAQVGNPTFETIYQRPIPGWFNEAKVGIFVTWGLYSVPSYVPKGYAEWYWKRSQHESAVKAFHQRAYGQDFDYTQFADRFTAELWDPDYWCEIFKKSGAKYVVTTANYHDGFAMYPTDYAETIGRKDWNSMVAGPKRDIIGELKEAGEKQGLKMGIYYSLIEWYHPWWENDRDRFVKEWYHPKFKEVVNRYKPWHIFLDGDWMSYRHWRSEELAHWLYTESAVKEYVVTNDRWGKPARGSYGDVFESEYGAGKYTSPEHPWQEDRGIGNSYGYNRMENIYDYDSRDELIRTLSGVVGGGGNFLLCVGPTADGRIPVIMQERLLQVGEWLQINGDAVYGSTASPFWPRTFDWGTVSKKPGKLFLHIHNTDIGQIQLEGLSAKINQVNLLTKKGKVPVKYEYNKETLSLRWPSYLNDKAVSVIEVEVEEGYAVDKTQRQYRDGRLEINCRAMTIHGGKPSIYYHGIQNTLWVADWTDPKDNLSIELIINTPGKYKLSAIYAAGNKANNWESQPSAGGTYKIDIAGNTVTSKIEATQNPKTPESNEVGTIQISKPGKYTLTIQPVDDGNWREFRFQGITLMPLEATETQEQDHTTQQSSLKGR
ncbi:alpha-L-fucosidase [Limibacter armeniacum]|uniref:alpha-L-fucosidase n=1 Tax=Limibacter armeniacum TaxID=466084 RepID=UPI002FE57D66